jgi:L-ascorbate metabolism protein UlaG (beta-lactamase superfamily)
MLAPKALIPVSRHGACRHSQPDGRLPVDVKTLLDADAVIVTHTHDDHWDQTAIELIAKDKPVYVQNDSDAALLRSQGFTHLTVMTEETRFGDIRSRKPTAASTVPIALMRCQSWQNVWAKPAAWSCAILMRRRYIAGDTIWREEVAADLQKHQPDVVVLNAGYAHVLGFGIIMGEQDVLNVHFLLPQAQIVAVHMEAINHCLLTRHALREYAEANQFSDALSIPQDGESVIF